MKRIPVAAFLASFPSGSAIAQPESFRVEKRIIAPVPGDASVERFPGSITRQDGKGS